MTSITYTRTAVCPGGDHVTMDVSVGGGPSTSVAYDIDEIRSLLANMTAEDKLAASKLVLAHHIAAKTRAQVASEFTNGTPVTVTI